MFFSVIGAIQMRYDDGDDDDDDAVLAMAVPKASRCCCSAAIGAAQHFKFWLGTQPYRMGIS